MENMPSVVLGIGQAEKSPGEVIRLFNILGMTPRTALLEIKYRTVVGSVITLPNQLH